MDPPDQNGGRQHRATPEGFGKLHHWKQHVKGVQRFPRSLMVVAGSILRMAVALPLL